jgi:hypothetical protein
VPLHSTALSSWHSSVSGTTAVPSRVTILQRILQTLQTLQTEHRHPTPLFRTKSVQQYQEGAGVSPPCLRASGLARIRTRRGSAKGQMRPSRRKWPLI